MFRSMTAFAHITHTFVIQGEKVSASLQLKTVNARFFEANFRLPPLLQHLEATLSKELKQSLHRGHAYVTIHLNASRLNGNIRPAFSVAREYYQALQLIQQELHISGTIQMHDLISLGHIVYTDESLPDPELEQSIIAALQLLITEVISQQEREGALLAQDLYERLNIMRNEIHIIEHLSEQLLEQHKQKVVHTIQELIDDESKFAELKKSALYAVLDKIDTHEEVIRFKEHITHLQNQLETPAMEKGKRLDFTLQELSREINTITSKCSDATISARAINIKVEIEKSREQVQNIL